MSDQSIIDQFYRSSNKFVYDSPFVGDTWQFLSDVTAGQGITNTIKFDTKTFSTLLVDYQSAYLAIPLTLKNSGVPYIKAAGAGGDICIKSSILSLINSVTLATAGGFTLVNDENIHLINNLRLLLDQSTNWMTTEAADMWYAPDVINSNQRSANDGANQRAQYMMNQAKINADDNIEVTVRIPLRYIHEVFNELGMQCNSTFRLEFGLNFLNNTASVVNGFTPFSVFTGTDYPIISIGNSDQTDVRLYFRQINLNASETARLSNHLSRGFTKEITFRCAELSPLLGSDINQPVASAVNKVVTPNVVKPLRLFVVPLVTGKLQSKDVSGATLWNAPLTFTDGQVKINTTTLFNDRLQEPFEFWQEVQRNMPGYEINSQMGNQLSFDMFMANVTASNPATDPVAYRYYIFDVSKTQSRLRSPTDPVSVTFFAQRSEDDITTLAGDYYYILEREQTIKMTYDGTAYSYSVNQE